MSVPKEGGGKSTLYTESRMSNYTGIANARFTSLSAPGQREGGKTRGVGVGVGMKG